MDFIQIFKDRFDMDNIEYIVGNLNFLFCLYVTQMHVHFVWRCSFKKCE